MKELWSWEPNKSLGPVAIGSAIEIYIDQHGFAYDEDSDPNDEWVSYADKSGDVYIDTEDGLVVSITAYRDFYYKHLNLIGANIIELGALLGQVADDTETTVEFDDGDVKSCYDFTDLGLQIWASRGIITSATCSNYKE
ncbi:hypothetical protein [Pseudomonas nitroreducens]|uniref:hypothetical protein n=1 Tax=Pseudomonas nitroreducens TaxID=46680 RepID=UPI00209D1923|nr:hypothetical protein [Pseudomonas nitroreducens]MCP1625406.1 hypothetical protein [Pseudomonas nitroreducens]